MHGDVLKCILSQHIPLNFGIKELICSLFETSRCFSFVLLDCALLAQWLVLHHVTFIDKDVVVIMTDTYTDVMIRIFQEC